jgi:hypothetical protein
LDQVDFGDQFGFTKGAFSRLGIRVSTRTPFTTTGMLRKARRGIAAARVDDLRSLSDAVLKEAIYGHMTVYRAGLAVDRGELTKLRDEANRRAS